MDETTGTDIKTSSHEASQTIMKDGLSDPAKTKPSGSDPQRPGFFSFDNLSSIGFMILIVFIFRWSIASPYFVPTGSMEPSIKVGDRLLAFKLAYNLRVPFLDTILFSWHSPKKGDIIVFRYPNDPSLDYVKRVVGTAGDEIRMIDDVLYVNGKAQTRSDFNHDRSVLEDIDAPKDLQVLFKEQLAGHNHWTINSIPSARHFSNGNWPDDGGVRTVPEGSVFVFGDNRDNSADSRSWGKVPLENVYGKALFVLWSAYSPKDSFLSVRFDRFGHWLDGDVPDDNDAPDA